MAEQDTSPDAELPLKKRARRRLVGATALALLAVIVLPMVMDREPRSMNQDIQVSIPGRDTTGIAAKVLSGKTVATPMPGPEAKAVAEPKIEPVTEPAAAVAAPDTKPPAAKAPAATVTPEKKPAPIEKPAAKKSVETKPQQAASSQWVVQLGAYRETGNVKNLLAKLKGIGVPAFTEHYDSPQGPRTRVRAGPFDSRDAADKARARIKIIGVDGPVAQK